MKRFNAEYNRNGYEVSDDGGIVHYFASNHRHDSQQFASPGTPDALPLRTIRSHAIKTCHEIAAEMGGVVGDVRRVFDSCTFDRQ